MKEFLRRLIAPALLIAMCFTIASGLNHLNRHTAQRPVTVQQKAEHSITFVGKGLCTATAVGPHAILTAAHCNVAELTVITFDMSFNRHNILSKSVDGRDHVIYIVDGPEFHDIVKLLPRVHPAKAGERVYMYGFGDGVYPAHYREGYKSLIVPDVSDIDQAEGISYYTFPAIPGDSGAAIFGDDGRIIAAMSYQYDYPKDGDWDTEDKSDILHLSAAFDVNFTAEQLLSIANGHGDTPMVQAPTPVKK